MTGDGQHTIGQLVDIANTDPRRGPGHSRELTRISLDADAIKHLDGLGLDDHSVPAAGKLVTLRRNANLSTGGTSRDVTELVHPEIADMCCRAAAVTGLDICGIDLRLADIGAPLHDPAGHGPAQPGAVLELNACPGLRMHLSPTEGTPRDVASAVLDSLYPPGSQARVPVVSVTGTNGKTTTVRMVGHVLRHSGVRAGLSCTDGVHIGSRLIYPADASGPRSAEMVLGDPGAEAAVLETARGGIVRRGLGYDRADVAVITNITADHLGDDGVDDLAELVHVKALVAEQIGDGGCVVLNADDPATAALADRPAVRRHGPAIRFFGLDPANPVMARHRESGGLCYEVRDGQLTETEGGGARPLLSVAELPGAFGGQARARRRQRTRRGRGLPGPGRQHQGHPQRSGHVHAGSRQSRPGQHLPGGRLSRHRRLRPQRRGAAGNGSVHRRCLGRRAGRGAHPAGRSPGRLAGAVRAGSRHALRHRRALYEDADKRGRAPGEMLALVGSALRAARPDIDCREAENPADALRAALAVANGAPVLFVYEKLALAHDALLAVGAQSWPEGEPPGDSRVRGRRGRDHDEGSRQRAWCRAGHPAGQHRRHGRRPGDGHPAGAGGPDRDCHFAPAAWPTAGRADAACDCDPLSQSAWPRLRGADGSADYGGACGCQPAG